MIDSKKLTVSFSRDTDIGNHPGVDGLIYYSIVMYFRKNITPCDTVGTTIKEIIIGCNDNPGNNRNSIKVKKYEASLKYMINSGAIAIGDELDNYKFNDYIKIYINPEKLFINDSEKYVISNCYDFDKIMQSKTKSKKTTMFAVYLHLCASMFKVGTHFSIAIPNINKLCNSLGISQNTLNKSIDDLVNIGMIYKSPHTTCFVNGNFINAKNIYTKTPGLLSRAFIINYWKEQLNTDYVKVQDK